MSKKVEKLAKQKQLDHFTQDAQGALMNTNTGTGINDDQNSLKAGERGPSLLEDFILREKITHFDHERIPERVVHARGSAAHGYFQVYKDLSKYTSAQFLKDPQLKTPVFVRFSTVAGSRGSTDMARDVRGFAVKFYTEQGNFDLVGNNMPVFFIQDAMKFPDLIHAVKPEPKNEIPQAASAHNTFWDFISIMPESMHMIMWVMSGRALPRSLRMMEGFGVHTFRLVNDKGESHFVKFHWKPLLGVHSLSWDEAQKISGKDADFHRRDLYDAIEAGAYPEWELGLQIIPEKDEHKFEFDLLDPTKLVPEELVPVERVGKLVLNRNPDNFFAETEQVAFHPAHIVPGIDFSNDPLLQGRLFSYLDTQLTRLGGPNFQEIPINRPIVPVQNNQRDGHMRQTINKGTSYSPNTIGGGCPFQAGQDMSGFVSYNERIDAQKIRGRSESFFDHFTQARMFYNSQSQSEKLHIVKALQFELGKVNIPEIKERMLTLLHQVDSDLATQVSEGLGLKVVTEKKCPFNHSVPADADAKDYDSKPIKSKVLISPALSMTNTVFDTIKSRQVAVLIADGFDGASLKLVKSQLQKQGAQVKLVAPRLGQFKGDDKSTVEADESLFTTSSALFDALYVPGGKASVEALMQEHATYEFLKDAFMHGKTIAATEQGEQIVQASCQCPVTKENVEFKPDNGIILNEQKADDHFVEQFATAIGKHRHWSRVK